MMRRRPRSTLSPYTTLFRSCHCTVAAGTPDAVAVNAASCPGLTLWSFGCPVTTGALSTVRVAAWVVAAPAGLVDTARNCLPLFAGAAPARVEEAWGAPGIAPPAPPVHRWQCTAAAGPPAAVA